MGELALLSGELVLHFPIVSRIFGVLPVTGNIQAVRRVVQSDSLHRLHFFGYLGLVLEKDCRGVSSGRAMLHGDGFQFPIVGDVLVLAYRQPSELG